VVVSCHPDEVTAFVDGELSGPARDRLVAHLSRPCPRCVAQSEEEREVRRRLRPLAGGGDVAALTACVRAALDLEDATQPVTSTDTPVNWAFPQSASTRRSSVRSLMLAPGTVLATARRVPSRP
jgi:anti-sigma factor RsiW